MLHSEEAEQAVIGAILDNPDAYYVVSDIITSKDFYKAQFRAIYEAIEFCASADKPTDLFVLADILEQTKQDPDSDWLPILATIQKNSVGSKNAPHYAKAIKDYSVLRRMYYATEGAKNIATDKRLTLEARMDQFRESLSAILTEEEEVTEGPVMVSSKVDDFIAHLEKCQKTRDGITGLRTGFNCIDDRTGGMSPGDFIVIAGRPSMGKSQLALQISEHIALVQNKPVLYFSLEMTLMQSMMRMAANIGDIKLGNIKRGSFDSIEMQGFKMACQRLKESNAFIFDATQSLTLEQLISRAHRENRKQRLAAVVVDHIGLVEVPGENTFSATSLISRSLKKLGKQLDIPIIGLAQLNRDCEKRPDKRPILSDLRNSGDIEQDADMIGFVYRDVVYNDGTAFPDLAELIWRKVKEGVTGTDYFEAQFQYSRFKETDKPEGVGKSFKEKYGRGKDDDHGL